MGVGMFLLAAAANGAIVFAPQAKVESPRVRLGDVADLSAVPPLLREKARALVLIDLREDRRRTVVDVAGLASRARALMPVLAPLLRSATGQVVIARHQARPALPEACGVEAGGIAKGESVTLRIRFGPVTIERAVRALQAADAGQQLFVSTPARDVIEALACG